MCYMIFFGGAPDLMLFPFLQLKKKLQFLTLGIGAIGVISAYVSYTPEITARQAYY